MFGFSASWIARCQRLEALTLGLLTPMTEADERTWSAIPPAALRALTDLGLADAFRLFEQPEKSFSWWDYRMMAFRRNAGLRIELILLSPELAARCTACVVDKTPRKLERPSDHAPVIATLS